MKNKRREILFYIFLLIIFILIILFCIKQFSSNIQVKKYSIISVNDNDKTLLGTLEEREQLKYLGYKPHTYPKLDELTKELEIKLKATPQPIASFLILAAYKAEKQAHSGNFKAIKNLVEVTPKVLVKIFDKGYPDIACTYVFCVLQSIERILTQEKVHIHDAFYLRLNKSLKEMDSIVSNSPNSPTNNFKENTLLEIRICLILLNMQQYKQQYGKYPTVKALEKIMKKIPLDPYHSNSQLQYNAQGTLWYIKSVGKNKKDDGYDAINYCPLPMDYSFYMPKDIVISSETRKDLKTLWKNKKIKNKIVSIKLLNKNGIQVDE